MDGRSAPLVSPTPSCLPGMLWACTRCRKFTAENWPPKGNKAFTALYFPPMRGEGRGGKAGSESFELSGKFWRGVPGVDFQNPRRDPELKPFRRMQSERYTKCFFLQTMHCKGTGARCRVSVIQNASSYSALRERG